MTYSIPDLQINGRAFSITKVVNGYYDNQKDPFELSVLHFCRDWLRGRKSFSIYTSGSTGKPKEINISRQQMIASANQTIDYFQLKSHDRILLCLNPNFIGGKMMLVRALVNNMYISAVTPSSNPLENINSEESFDFTALSPQQLFNMIKSKGHKIQILDQMKAVIVGGAPIDYHLLEIIQQLKVPIFSTYGMTETVSHIALRRVNGNDPDENFEAIGDVRLEVDERGCLTIVGSVTAHKKVFTNDLVELITEKRFKWLGRIDHVINSGGIKIHIEELESKIERFFQQQEHYFRFIIFSLPDKVLGQRVCLLIENKAPLDIKLRESLFDNLTKFEKPKDIYFVEKFIETASGKIDRKRTIERIKDIQTN